MPREFREGSLALGATKLETMLKVVIPSALPGILTGLILSMARAAGEVAPLMLTGVVKLAPSLPVDGSWPFFTSIESLCTWDFIFTTSASSPPMWKQQNRWSTSQLWY